VTPAALEEFAAAMVRSKVLRFKGEVGPPEQEDEEECEIELHPSAFTTLAPIDTTTPALPEPETKCACGHDLIGEHNDSGLCIAGACPYTVCHPEAKPRAEEA
jgi:hypothetical protein